MTLGKPSIENSVDLPVFIPDALLALCTSDRRNRHLLLKEVTAWPKSCWNFTGLSHVIGKGR
jgi:hypothetical protein